MLYTYKIRYYDDDKNELISNSGLVSANSYGEAADKVVKFYGENSFICFDDLTDHGSILTTEDIDEMEWV